MKATKHISLASFIFLLLLLSLPAWARSGLPGHSIEEILGGPENKAVVESPKTIEVYRVFFDGGDVPKTATGRISGFPCLPTPVRYSRVEVERVIASILNQDTYRETTLCIFMPGILFRFVADESTFDFVVCFSCSDLLMSRDGNRSVCS